MSVRPEALPSGACLATSEGALISISIAVEPRCLEILLETLAELEFPVNPQIYHDAAVITRFADGREESAATTLVEFPAYSGRAEEVRRAVLRIGFDPSSMLVTGMLEEIQSDLHPEPIAPGADYIARYRVRRAAASALRAAGSVYQP